MGFFDFLKKKKEESSQEELTPEQYVDEGQKMMREGKSDVAVKYFEKAANKGFPQGIFMLGNAKMYGNGIKQDVLSACQLYSKAAQLGSEEARKILFVFLDAYYKECVSQNRHKDVLPYLKLGAEAGHIQSQAMYGQFLCLGVGFEKNKAEGCKWLKMSADAGNSAAKEYLEGMR